MIVSMRIITFLIMVFFRLVYFRTFPNESDLRAAKLYGDIEMVVTVRMSNLRPSGRQTKVCGYIVLCVLLPLLRSNNYRLWNAVRFSQLHVKRLHNAILSPDFQELGVHSYPLCKSFVDNYDKSNKLTNRINIYILEIVYVGGSCEIGNHV